MAKIRVTGSRSSRKGKPPARGKRRDVGDNRHFTRAEVDELIADLEHDGVLEPHRPYWLRVLRLFFFGPKGDSNPVKELLKLAVATGIFFLIGGSYAIDTPQINGYDTITVFTLGPAIFYFSLCMICALIWRDYGDY